MAKKKKTLQLSKSLVLNRFLLHQFGVQDLTALAENLKSSELEGRDENNVSRFYHELVHRMYGDTIGKERLLAYDENIVSHTLHINAKRKEPIEWKYFQYLALLFTEYYLDRFFGNRASLLDDLNRFLERWKDPLDREIPREPEVSEISPFQYNDLNKLSYWMATGSGKTLLMHVNLRQYQYYQHKYGGPEMQNILLITPNEGLSQQHEKELNASGIEVDRFSGSSARLFSGRRVEIIEISKLAEEAGDKTISVDAFEQRNLVLVDESHRGVSGEAWKDRRDRLSAEGFAFEYSATFGQSTAAATGPKKKDLLEEYGKNILFDYSYRYFYEDGYGKDYQILNLRNSERDEFRHKYLIGALLSFYQQRLIYTENRKTLKPFKIDNPLWLFVGGSVNDRAGKKDTSDIAYILGFFAQFIKDQNSSQDILDQLINGRDGILDEQNRSIFDGAFTYLSKRGLSAEQLYRDILNKVFGSTTPGAQLYVDNLKNHEGELGIRVGDEAYVGVINVGDDKKLHRKLQDLGIPGIDRDFGHSIFQGINDENSPVNILIGARKFSEGWNSYRVATMGLMNIGRSEGSQIIQLFGRGVRLKGYNFSLKRSTELDIQEKPEDAPPYLQKLETLQIFGIRADYMEQFKQFLEDEGIPKNDGTWLHFKLPTMANVDIGPEKLKILRVRKDVDFKKDRVVVLRAPDDDQYLDFNLDWHPKVQALHSGSSGLQDNSDEPDATEPHHLSAEHLAFFDWDAVFLEIEKFKNERTWYNLSLNKEVLQAILQDPKWYTLYIPGEELEPKSFSQVSLWQDIGIALLKGYIDRFYNQAKSHYLGMHMETVILDKNDPNFIAEYNVYVNESKERIIGRIKELQSLLATDTLQDQFDIQVNSFSAFQFLEHLYKPLLYLDERKMKNIISIKPTALNKGEWDFVKDLKRYYEKHAAELKGKKLYLLRNQSKKGVGFFTAHGFYPDFILWLIDGDKQYVNFIDPKGLRHITGLDHPKMHFYRTIKKEIEDRLTDDTVTLNSFIVSVTPYAKIKHWKGQESIRDFNQAHIFFRPDQSEHYIKKIIDKVRSEATPAVEP